MATSLPSLPGETTRITARRVLVLAPHFDDELLGCGGLLIQLAAGGAEVRVLFLSDGSGGEEAVGDREAYAARRRGEAQAVARLLRFAGIEELGARDGFLAADRQRDRAMGFAPRFCRTVPTCCSFPRRRRSPPTIARRFSPSATFCLRCEKATSCTPR